MQPGVFSFGKELERHNSLPKSVRDILDARSSSFPVGWFFLATVVSPIQPFLDENQEIRLSFEVAEDSNAQQTLTVILGEKALRNYLPILQQNTDYRFKDGDIILNQYSNNYIFMPQHCDILKIQTFNDDTGLFNQGQQLPDVPQRQSRPQREQKSIMITSQSKCEIVQMKESPKRSKSVIIDNKQPIPPPIFTSVQLDSFKTRAKSLDIKTNVQQFADFKAKVLCQYQVGKDKFNHGTGYQVEQIRRKIVYEVVVWSEVGLVPPLVRGKAYSFYAFKVHRKGNYEMSFHSHFQHSTIQELK